MIIVLVGLQPRSGGEPLSTHLTYACEPVLPIRMGVPVVLIEMKRFQVEDLGYDKKPGEGRRESNVTVLEVLTPEEERGKKEGGREREREGRLSSWQSCQIG